MKKIFKLAAIAVSVALATSLVACSSGDDDVVDASTPEYLVAAQINRYVDSIKYDNQNLSDAQIKPLKDANKAMVDMLGECDECLSKYFAALESKVKGCGETVDLDEIEVVKSTLKNWKDVYVKHDTYHEWNVYRPAIWDALEEVQPEIKSGDVITQKSSAKRKNVLDIDSIVEEKLNDRQAANMNTYIGAAEALKAALNEDDANKRKTKVESADNAIKAFNELENKNVNKAEIKKVVDAVDEMYFDIRDNVLNKIENPLLK